MHYEGKKEKSLEEEIMSRFLFDYSHVPHLGCQN